MGLAVKRFLIYALSVLAAPAYADLISVTNTRASAAGILPAFNLYAEEGPIQILYTVKSSGEKAIDFSIDESDIVLEIRNKLGRVEYSLNRDAAQDIYPGTGQLRYVIGYLPAGEYDFRGVVAPPDGGAEWKFTWHTMSVTSAPAQGGVNVSITTTANVSVVEEGSGNVITGATANGSVVTVQRGSVVGGGGGDITINGHTTNTWNFQYVYPIVGSNVGNTIYWGLTSLDGGIVVVPSYSNVNEILYGSATTVSYVVGVGVTQLFVEAWGGAGGSAGSAANDWGSGGGATAAWVPVTPGEVLTVYIGQSGTNAYAATATTNETFRAWPNGGKGIARNTYRAGGGGGSTSLWRGTNVLVVAGGGGGVPTSGSATIRGEGGGSVGGVGALYSGATGGEAGTQTTAGYNGGFMSGGDSTGLPSGNFSGAAAGGGGGYFGGGGTEMSASSATRGGGGGGSGFINTLLGCYGITVRATLYYAARTDSPNYPTSPYSAGQPTSDHWSNSDQAHGAMVISHE